MQLSESQTWDLMSEEYTRWRGGVDTVAGKVRQGASETLPRAKPAFNTSEWWDAVIYPCLRNLELACSKHERGGDERPPDLELLALARGGTDPFAVPADEDKPDFDIEELDVDGLWRAALGDVGGTASDDLGEPPEPVRAKAQFPIVPSRRCAALPGCAFESVALAVCEPLALSSLK